MAMISKSLYLTIKKDLTSIKKDMQAVPYLDDPYLPRKAKFSTLSFKGGGLTDPIILPKQFLVREPKYKIGLLTFYNVQPSVLYCIYRSETNSHLVGDHIRNLSTYGQFLERKHGDYSFYVVNSSSLLNFSSLEFFGGYGADQRRVRFYNTVLACRCSASELP